MIRRFSLLLISFFVCHIVLADDYLQIVSLLSSEGGKATFSSAGISMDKKEIEANAAKSVFYTLFYQGVAGINDGKPLVNKDNKLYTNSYFNSTDRYSFYVVSVEEVEKPKKVAGSFRANYNVTIYINRLINDLISNKVHVKALTVDDIDETEGLTKPTIMVVPFLKDGENYASVLENDYDRRIAVSRVQNGFESRDITTVDFLAKLQAEKRQQNYESNVAESNDRNLLLSSSADVYVTVDLQKDSSPQGSRVSLIMKAYERVSGDVLASKDGWTNRFRTTATDALCGYAVEDLLPAFLDDICKNFTQRIGQGSRVVLRFAIDASSSMTMSTQAGPNNYSLSNIIRQWVRKNAYKGKYHLQGIVDEGMIFDYVTIPPKDADGLLMDAAQYAFLIESFLKEENGINCSSRIEGNTIFFTIFD